MAINPAFGIPGNASDASSEDAIDTSAAASLDGKNADQPTGTKFDGLGTAEDTPIPPDELSQQIAAVFERRQGNAPSSPIDRDTDAPTKPPVGTTDSTDTTSDTPPGEGGDAPAQGGGELTQPPAAGSTADQIVPGGDDETDGGTTPHGAPPSSLVIDYGDGQQHTLDVEGAKELLALAGWANSLPDDIKGAFAAIEQGQAVAIDREEYQGYLTWRQTQKAGPGQTTDSDLDDLDPEVARLIAGMQAQIASLSQQQPAQFQQQDYDAQQRIAARAREVEQIAGATVTAYGAERGIEGDELEALYEAALNSGVIPQLAQRNRVLNPVNGQVLREADTATVVRQALDFALVQNPALHTRVLSPVPARDATPSAAEQATALKKARGSSLASAPSAAITTPPRDPRTMTPQERTSGMADMIRAAQSA